MGLQRSHDSAALREVAAREYRRDEDGLVAQLRDPDASVRRWAARDLAGHPTAAGALGERLLQETDASVREAIFTSLGSMHAASAVDVLLPLLRSEDAGLRNGAIEALAEMPEQVAPRIAALLRDADSDVRIFTVNLLGELRHAQVSAWLAQVLAHDTQVNVVAAAIEVLAETGSPADIAALRAAQVRFAGDAFIGFATDMAVERIGDA